MGMMLHRKASLRNQGAVEKKTAPVVVSEPKEEVVEPVSEVVEESTDITEDAPKKDVQKSRRRRKNV